MREDNVYCYSVITILPINKTFFSSFALIKLTLLPLALNCRSSSLFLLFHQKSVAERRKLEDGATAYRRLEHKGSFLFASMTKKKSKKTPSQLQENTIGEEQNPSSAPKNSGSEMDEIFARIKKKFAVEKAEKLDEVTEKTDREKKNDTIGEEQTPSSAPKKLGSEIDEIFAGKKRKKSEVEKAKPDEVTKNTDRKKTNNRKKIKGRDDGEFVDRPSRPRKRTEDGLTLYTEEELGFNKGDAGGTPLCPFDCSCCF